MTALELAVRFGKTLLIQEMDSIDPALFPLLRGDFISHGPRFNMICHHSSLFTLILLLNKNSYLTSSDLLSNEGVSYY